MNSSHISLPSDAIGGFKVITVELWADLPSISSTNDVLSLFYFGEPSSTSARCSHSQSQGKIVCSVCTNPSSCSAMTSFNSYSSTSIHLVITFDSISGSVGLYVNSVWQCSLSFGSSLPDSGSSDFKFLIGTSPSSTNELSFVGSVDEFRVWAGPIPSSTITSHFENGPTSDNVGEWQIPSFFCVT